MSLRAGVEILRECEKALRECLAKTAAAGDYDAVLCMTEWAQQIAHMSSVGEEQSLTNRALPRHSDPKGEALRSGNNEVDSSSNDQKLFRQNRKQSGRKPAQSGYPKFMRQKDELIKIGWSKSEKKVYQHRAPCRAIALLIARLTEIGGRGELFTTDELFPLVDKAEGTEIPIYQSYICLAWLRQESIIEAEGRQGYRVSDPKHLDEAWEEAWRRLPDYRA